MSETSGGFTSADLNKLGPDYFTFYTCEVKELLSQNEDFLPFAAEIAGNRCEEVRGNNVEPSSGSLFDKCIGAGLSDCKKERLNALLRQTLATLVPEVDEMLDPVVAMRRLQSKVRNRKLISGLKDVMSEGETEQNNANKRIKKSSSSSTNINTAASPVSSGSCREGSASKCMGSKCSDVALPGKGMSTVVQKHCTCCSTNNPNGTADQEGKFQCNACGTTSTNESEFHLASNTSADKVDEEFLLENDSSLVEASIKKYSDQLFTMLGHMEKQLEELLDVVVSTCRPMSLAEKKQLQKLIQKLPPKNLNRVAEIVQRSKSLETQNCDEIFVDLEKEYLPFSRTMQLCGGCITMLKQLKKLESSHNSKISGI
ncbi:uncharacterized protein LOC110656586 isoform X2 [Hevea brasiliensis]|uniref:uncharacterized protein LOC110656586 isoform X2 n=1 Tax=Hevea brasiliensis TaxID=3981 RepID=UPI0025E360CF|nr:uncharacterized protein LOC110656586 isoform X2 [Hevea brasiliensis]